MFKSSAKQIMDDRALRSLQNQLSVYSKTAMTLSNDKSITKMHHPSINIELPPLQNPALASDSCSNTPRPDEIVDDDRMISSDWKLTVNDLNPTSKNGQVSVESDANTNTNTTTNTITATNQPSNFLDIPIPNEVHENVEMAEAHEFEINLDEHDPIEEEEDEEDETSIDDLPDLDIGIQDKSCKSCKDK